MNVILIPRKPAGGRNVSFSHGQVAAASLVLFAVLPAIFAVLAYHVAALLDRSAVRQPEYIQAQERKLVMERALLAQTRVNAEAHLHALAYKLGELQAQVNRLNALGGRLTQVAGLDRRSEFNFSATPAVGGPEQVMLGNTALTNVMRSLAQLSIEVDDRAQRLTHIESALLDHKVEAAVTPVDWPVEGGWVSSGFGVRTDPFTGHQAYHEGVDIANSVGARIRALGSGLVVRAGPAEGYGLMVEINHGRGQHTRYAHAQSVLVKEGDKVEKGQAIALIGSSGRSTGPHLHLEVRQDGRAVDPRTHLRVN